MPEITAARIYLDHAATTPVDAEVLEALLPHLTSHTGNPSSLYLEGRQAHAALETARERIASVFRAEPGEIVFTGGGSEGANLAVKGAAFAGRREGRSHIVTSAVEHQAVRRTVAYLQRQHKFDVTYVPVDSEGRVDAQAVLAAVRADTALVSIIYASNEVGTIQPIAEIGAGLRRHPALFHTDAVQAAGSLSLDTQALNVALLSIAAHKIYGPKGVGAIYLRSGVRIMPQILGGTQERGRRAGTENVAFALGLATALVKADVRREAYNDHNRRLTNILFEGILPLPGIRLTGPRSGRLANSVSFCIEGLEIEALLSDLDAAGIAASSGSACTSASLEPSHVLLAMGVPAQIARGSLRLTTGWSNGAAQMRRVVDMLEQLIPKLRGRLALAQGAGVD